MAAPIAYPDFHAVGHREFVIFFHDEPEFCPSHDEEPEEDPCPHPGSGGGHGDHGCRDGLPPIMPVSYRAEPMINREHKLWRLERTGHNFQGRPVLNEEQHHSSWMFGDPATPILKAYIGDPVRIRFVHAGVKETHVFHLHLYEWHAVPEATDYTGQFNGSPRIDAISVSPQTAHTIEPVWGAGNRHQVAGDIIWHCHLYPHFHEGMWGLFRTFETLQTGALGPWLAGSELPGSVYAGRQIGRYPDRTRIERLLPLPDRVPPPAPTSTHPGYPLYIPGQLRQKSPIPPWPDRPWQAREQRCHPFDSLLAADMPADFNYRPVPTRLERNAFNACPVPGEMFTRNPFAQQQAAQWRSTFDTWNVEREVCHDVVVAKQRIDYNGYGWHDKHGHLYYLDAEEDPDTRRDSEDNPIPKEPLFFRALHQQILNLTLDNQTRLDIEETAFDRAFPPCSKRAWEGECALHVHMVKFDPICADGASTGWNYMSGPVVGMKMVYRWWLDQEFGTIFFHDHLFANYRQKHGLFGALLVEPTDARFFHHVQGYEIVSGLQAIVTLREEFEGRRAFREFCLGIADFIPMWDRNDRPLNPPDHPGGHGDQGVMALNYRSDPIHERLREGGLTVDPAYWFTSLGPYNRDPYTTRFLAYESDPIWFRMIQGSHEEQHSFQTHGMRWQRFRGSTDSALRNQQTFGLSEAFTFINREPYGAGDYLYKLSAADDLWLGCWGLIRVFPQDVTVDEAREPLPLVLLDALPTAVPLPPPVFQMRRFRVAVKAKRLVYREPDLVDPFGLIYELIAYTPPYGHEHLVPAPTKPEPLVLRCREGEWVQVTVENQLPEGFMPRPEPFAPQVPVEEQGPGPLPRPQRPVSAQVSMHADLLRYDVRFSDGANVGRNMLFGEQTAAPGDSVTYTWNTYRPPHTNANQPLGPILLQDMADVRNHRHHGLIGALIVEDRFATPYRVRKGRSTATGTESAWYGVRATVVVRRPWMPPQRVEEAVLLLQNGLRLYWRGKLRWPIPDEPPGHGEDETDHEDQGQKGYNYRSEPADPEWRDGKLLSKHSPATPIFRVPVRSTVHLHLLGACDKPRNHSFTVHGVAWPEWRFLSPTHRRWVSSEGAISAGTVRTFAFSPSTGAIMPTAMGFSSGWCPKGCGAF
ncbi:multicopper oxidase domain-containing protein [Hymenobacter qilianensis]|nr:multicopper oxidase domain-containing protein [Hymenobacter qilianensis]